MLYLSRRARCLSITELAEESAGRGWGSLGLGYPHHWEGSRGQDASLHYSLVLFPALMYDSPFRSFGSTYQLLCSSQAFFPEKVKFKHIQPLQFSFIFQTTGGIIAVAQHIFFLSDMVLYNVYVLSKLQITARGFSLVHRSASLCDWEHTFCIDFQSIAKKYKVLIMPVAIVMTLLYFETKGLYQNSKSRRKEIGLEK